MAAKKVDHLQHGRVIEAGTPDCPCFKTKQRKACAATGCLFCSSTIVETELYQPPMKATAGFIIGKRVRLKGTGPTGRVGDVVGVVEGVEVRVKWPNYRQRVGYPPESLEIVTAPQQLETLYDVRRLATGDHIYMLDRQNYDRGGKWIRGGGYKMYRLTVEETKGRVNVRAILVRDRAGKFERPWQLDSRLLLRWYGMTPAEAIQKRLNVIIPNLQHYRRAVKQEERTLRTLRRQLARLGKSK